MFDYYKAWEKFDKECDKESDEEEDGPKNPVYDPIQDSQHLKAKTQQEMMALTSGAKANT